MAELEKNPHETEATGVSDKGVPLADLTCIGLPAAGVSTLAAARAAPDHMRTDLRSLVE